MKISLNRCEYVAKKLGKLNGDKVLDIGCRDMALKNNLQGKQRWRDDLLMKIKKTLSEELVITAETEDGVIMGVQHKKFNIHGVQFHPESIKAKFGMKILKNFINY